MKNYVGFWRRFVAYCIDTFILGSLLMIFASSTLTSMSATQSSWVNLIAFAASALYFIFFWSFQDGQTLGNRFLKFKVINEDGSKLVIGGAILRYFGLLISFMFLFLGVIWVGLDKKKQGWHDKIARTLVVEVGKPNIALVIVTFLGLLILYSIFMTSYITKIVMNSDSIGNVNVSDRVINSMTIVAFSKVNELRKSKNIPELEIDNRLCAYSQRRLEQLNTLGKYDDGKGFYEDTADPSLQRAYFMDTPMTGEFSREMGELDYAEIKINEMVSSWAAIESSNIFNKSFKKGCIRGNKDFVIFILGGAK